MKRKCIFVALAFVSGVALHGENGATAAGAVTPAQAVTLGDKVGALGSGKLIEVQKRRGRRDGRSRSRHRRRDRGPRFGIYIAPPLIYGPAYRSAGRCGPWRQRCAARWGFGNPNYYDCMYHRGCR